MVASLGVEQSVRFMAFTATCGLAGLGFVFHAGFFSGRGEPGRLLSELPSVGDAGVLTGVLSAVFLSIYTFIGFEDMSHMAEEVEKPRFSMPFGTGAAVDAVTCSTRPRRWLRSRSSTPTNSAATKPPSWASSTQPACPRGR